MKAVDIHPFLSYSREIYVVSKELKCEVYSNGDFGSFEYKWVMIRWIIQPVRHPMLKWPYISGVGDFRSIARDTFKYLRSGKEFQKPGVIRYCVEYAKKFCMGACAGSVTRLIISVNSDNNVQIVVAASN